uniref:ARAD1B09482p n=1 Tax=Blastobotrys adeninivorans TaxID=409370 RepID=A0A060TAS6_BLAAD
MDLKEILNSDSDHKSFPLDSIQQKETNNQEPLVGVATIPSPILSASSLSPPSKASGLSTSTSSSLASSPISLSRSPGASLTQYSSATTTTSGSCTQSIPTIKFLIAEVSRPIGPHKGSPLISPPITGTMESYTYNMSEGYLKRFSCSTCRKRFARKSDLVRHERIHSGDRPNKCHICNKAFIQRSALTVHSRVHTGEKPHKCDICAKSFSDSSSLARHRRIHTGSRPYVCHFPGCEKTFTRRTTLTRHKATHGGEWTEILQIDTRPLAIARPGNRNAPESTVPRTNPLPPPPPPPLPPPFQFSNNSAFSSPSTHWKTAPLSVLVSRP